LLCKELVSVVEEKAMSSNQAIPGAYEGKVSPGGWASPSVAEENKVGLFLISADHPYQRLLARDAQETAQRHGLDLEVVFSENFAAQQAQDIMRFVHANPDRQLGIVVMTVSDSMSTSQAEATEEPFYKLARRVVAKGAGCMILNREVDAQARALRQEFPGQPIGLVTPDQRELGRIQGAQFRALLPRGGRLLYVLGVPHISSTQNRREGMRDAIVGGAIAVDELDGLWSAQRTEEVVYKWLLAPSRLELGFPDLVGCQNDEMALGAREALGRAADALKMPRLARVPVTGLDGLPEGGQRWVAEGKLAATIVVPATSGRAIDLLVERWASGRPTPLKTVQRPLSFPPLEELRPIA
jgi:ABC-type sugar transport system substrate-binding protein